MITSFSHAALQSFEQCPRQFKFHYIEGIELPKRVPAAVYLGQAVHQALALAYQMVADGKVPTLDVIEAQYLKEWEKPERKDITVDREYMTVDDYIELGRRMVSTYYRKYCPFDQGKLILVEEFLRGHVPNTDFRLSGKVDRLSRLPDGTLEICDYKTGGSFPKGGRDPMFYRQMGLYQLLVQENFPDFKEIELVQHYLKPDEVVKYRMSEEELDQLIEEIRTTITLIVRASRSDEFPPKEGSYCSFCEYQQLCPAKRHRLILEGEAGKVAEEEKTTAEMAASLAEKYIEMSTRVGQLKAECDALREDVIKAAKELGYSKLAAKSGMVSVSLKTEEKFPSKSVDQEGYNKLSQVVRELGLDEYLKVDDYALRDAYIKKRLPQEHLAILQQFVATKESATVRVTKKKEDEEVE